MFDIGFFELLLIAVVGLIVIGPKRLPETIQFVGLWVGRIRRSFSAARKEFENEFGIDDVRRQLHNEAVMKELGEPTDHLTVPKVEKPDDGEAVSTGNTDNKKKNEGRSD